MERKGPADLLLFFITLMLLSIGLIMVLSASSYDALLHYDNALYYFQRQIFFMLLGFVFMFIMMHIKPEFVKSMAVPAMLLCVLMLILALTKEKTSRLEGVICVLCYVAYSAYIIIR